MLKEELQSIKRVNLDQYAFDFDQESLPIELSKELDGVILKKVNNPIQSDSDVLDFCHQQTLTLHIQDNVQINRPIELKLVESGKDRAFTLLIQAGENSQATIIEKYENKSDQLILVDQQIQAEANSRIRLINIQNLTEKSTLFEWHESFVKNNAQFNYYSFQIGAGTVYSDLLQNSDEPEAKLQSDILCRGHKKQDFTLKAEHVYSHKNSKGEINARGAALEESKVEIKGGVHITQTGSGCEGYLQQNCLLLSPSAKIKATPALKVDTNDVKAGHGAAISNLNEDSIFYMMSRGLDEASAKQILLSAFLKEILNKIDDLPELKEEIEKMI